MSNTYCLVVLTTEVFTAQVKRNSVVSWVSPRPKAFWECLPTPNGNQRHSLTPPPTLVLTSGNVATVKTDVKNSRTRPATGPPLPASHAQQAPRTSSDCRRHILLLKVTCMLKVNKQTWHAASKSRVIFYFSPNTSATTNSKEF